MAQVLDLRMLSAMLVECSTVASFWRVFYYFSL